MFSSLYNRFPLKQSLGTPDLSDLSPDCLHKSGEEGENFISELMQKECRSFGSYQICYR